ncbi:MAG: enolase [Candidatus Aenigmatarchaeota archaeon]
MIKDVRAFSVFNSSGKEALAMTMITDKSYTVSVPEGTSRGEFEAAHLPVDTVLKKFEKIKKSLIGLDENNYEDIELYLQKIGGDNFKTIGGNLALAISLATAKAAMRGELWKLNPHQSGFPYPLGNVVGGGAHGGKTDIQEFLLIPENAKTVADAIETNRVIRKLVGEALSEQDALTGKNLENAWTSNLDDINTFELIHGIARKYGARLGVDMAATQLWKNGKYNYPAMKKSLGTPQQMDFVVDLVEKYKLAYVEDPFHEKDFEAFAELTARIGGKCIVAGDDLYCTQYSRLEQGIQAHSTNGIIIKLNQVGLLSLAQKTANLAKRADMVTIASHRSRDTADAWLADIAVAFGCELIKTGIVGKEREAKLNRLADIWGKVEKPRMAKLGI